MPVNRRAFGKPVRHLDPDAIPFLNLKPRARKLTIEGVGINGDAGEYGPADHGGLEAKRLHPVVQLRLKHLVTASLKTEAGRNVLGMNRGHVPHGCRRRVTIHNHARGHYCATHIPCAE